MSSQTNNNDKPAANSSSKSNVSLETDIVYLKQVISSQPSDENADVNLTVLLRHLETASGVAEGVEERIDGIIGNLDMLLDSLERETEKGAGSEVGASSKPADKDSKERAADGGKETA
ncbi:hypothetical protein EVG20_g9324 [Dentipellis fragilis]|uniref:Uncharacterized protein n=1 Tax=Dentipellis fragilis TaxID=205917 RepID=A0A4Y9Y0H1_9AGAM|nr:hypothetical protein EVG20_g9324 [Dentipellis fragilis]